MNNNGQNRNHLQNLLTQATQRIEEVWRWKKYAHNHKQNVLGHTLETVLLTQIVIILEEKFGREKIDQYLLLSCAGVHDLG
jgi:5'-deoxynucleotidase YfbR-like HD superfamily hydrolase